MLRLEPTRFSLLAPVLPVLLAQPAKLPLAAWLPPLALVPFWRWRPFWLPAWRPALRLELELDWQPALLQT